MMNKIKGLFSTPKRAVLSTLAIVLAIGLIGTGALFASVYWDVHEDRIENAIERKVRGNDAPPATDTATTQDASTGSNAATGNDTGGTANTAPDAGAAAEHQKITAEKAEEIALADAGFAKSDVKNLYSHYEMDDGIYQYEVQFFQGEYEYEYTISAETGDIFEKDFDYIYD